MKTLHFFACLPLAFSLIGCGQSEKSSSGNPVTAPVDYLGAVGQAKISAEKTLDTASINQAIQMFATQEGRYPKDLDELVTHGELRQIPKAPYGMKLVYDASSGTVKVVKAP